MIFLIMIQQHKILFLKLIKEKSKEEKIIELEDDIKNLKEIINFKEKDIKANPNISNLYIPSLNEKKEELKKSENELKILNSN